MLIKSRVSYLIVSCCFFICSCEQNKGNNLVEHSIYTFINRAVDNPPESVQRLDSAYEYVAKSPDRQQKLDYLFKLGSIYYNKNDLQKFRTVSEKSIALAYKLKDTASAAKALRFKAEYYNSEQVFDSAFKYYRSSERLYQSISDLESLARTLYKKSLIQFYEHDYLGADLSLTEANSYLKSSNDSKLKYQVLSMRGIVSNEIGDYKNAIEFHQKAFQQIDAADFQAPENEKSTTLNNIGIVYQNLAQHNEAIKNFSAALANNNLKAVMPDLYARLLDNKGYSELKLKNFSNLPKHFLESLKIRDSLKMMPDVISSKIHLSEYYHERHDSVNSKKLASEAFSNASEINSPIDRLISLKQLLAVDKVRASKLSVQYTSLTDSLQQVERKSRDKFSRLQFETKEITQAKDKLEVQNRNLVYFFVGFLLIGVLLFVIRSQRAKNRELLLVQAQQKANEDIYNLMITQQDVIDQSREKEQKRIAQELHDGVLGRLFGVRLNLDSLNKVNAVNTFEKRNHYLGELKNIEQDIREISHDLNREKSSLINNFVAILTNYLEEQKLTFCTNINFKIDDTITWENIGNSIKINLFRILQESIQNINKYAEAKNIHVKIIKALTNIEMYIEDDGKGFDLNVKKRGIGLENMTSRVKELNGLIEIKSNPGQGTTIYISIPAT